MIRVIILLCAIMILAGCGKKQNETTQKKKQPSITETVIDGATGRTAVRQGHIARKKIAEASKKKNDDLDGLMGE